MIEARKLKEKRSNHQRLYENQRKRNGNAREPGVKPPVVGASADYPVQPPNQKYCEKDIERKTLSPISEPRIDALGRKVEPMFERVA